MSRSRTERLVNLVICLLSTRRLLTAGQIAATVPGYQHDSTDPREHEAFQRMFERDKAELRHLGVPLETGAVSTFDPEPGYRIARRDYALPDVHLEPEEAAAVGIAARLWQHADLAAAASSGLLKLRAAGVEVDPASTLGVAHLMSVDPAFAPLQAAVRERRAVRFDYRVPEDDAATQRHLYPWGVVSWRGRWYVVGHDLDREATRCFRLSRIISEVRAHGRAGAFDLPPDLDLRDHVATWSGRTRTEPTGRATVLLRPGRAAGIRRGAVEIISGPDGDRAVLRYADPDALARWLVGFGADLIVEEPDEVRKAVIARLRDLVTATDLAADDLGATDDLTATDDLVAARPADAARWRL
jgi:proteasome accessory factor B